METEFKIQDLEVKFEYDDVQAGTLLFLAVAEFVEETGASGAPTISRIEYEKLAETLHVNIGEWVEESLGDAFDRYFERVKPAAFRFLDRFQESRIEIYCPDGGRFTVAIDQDESDY